ncbi:hypothetical protein [Leptolyngbya sp. 7M]|uniref:hypothetical protein n=1 Tax=Leptolyngbya sp. 7M TaxID=2812896 RepID=UPI001B8B50F2|nr:hypothetical protein [Leptolyngbya sp. 7M]QYO65136.1 hypothetical protein JVX88_37535 [Leptolyngbya sp. 7M]
MALKVPVRQSGFKQLSLRLILIVPFVLQIAVAVGLTGYLAIRNGQKSVHTITSQLRSEISSHINQQILTYLEKPYLVNQMIAAGILFTFRFMG